VIDKIVPIFDRQAPKNLWQYKITSFGQWFSTEKLVLSCEVK